MRVTVRYHALLREKTGRDRDTFEIPLSSAKVSHVISAFVKTHPAFERLAAALNVAVNEEITIREASINDGDTIDLMPPFGGG